MRSGLFIMLVQEIRPRALFQMHPTIVRPGGNGCSSGWWSANMCRAARTPHVGGNQGRILATQFGIQVRILVTRIRQKHQIQYPECLPVICVSGRRVGPIWTPVGHTFRAVLGARPGTKSDPASVSVLAQMMAKLHRPCRGPVG